jgi:hypothetical protein
MKEADGNMIYIRRLKFCKKLLRFNDVHFLIIVPRKLQTPISSMKWITSIRLDWSNLQLENDQPIFVCKQNESFKHGYESNP